MPANVTEAATTYTLDQFIQSRYSDDMTYYNFSILEKNGNLTLLDHNLIDEYLTELESICLPCPLNNEQYKKYRFSPDLLAYDVYGSTQLDFIILKANDMIDPKEFDLKTIKLPYASALKAFLSSVYNSNQGYISQNRADNGIKMYN